MILLRFDFDSIYFDLDSFQTFGVEQWMDKYQWISVSLPTKYQWIIWLLKCFSMIFYVLWIINRMSHSSRVSFVMFWVSYNHGWYYHSSNRKQPQDIIIIIFVWLTIYIAYAMSLANPIIVGFLSCCTQGRSNEAKAWFLGILIPPNPLAFNLSQVHRYQTFIGS